MVEYIKREYVNQIIFHYARGQEDKTKDLIAIIAQSVNALPNADVVERKKGKWLSRGMCEWRCSECGKIIFADDSNEMNFCPSCGADMKGKDE